MGIYLFMSLSSSILQAYVLPGPWGTSEDGEMNQMTLRFSRIIWNSRYVFRVRYFRLRVPRHPDFLKNQRGRNIFVLWTLEIANEGEPRFTRQQC